MGWFSDMKDSAEAKFKEKAEAYARDMVMNTIKANLKLENLAKLKRVLLLSANQEIVEASWPRFEAVVTKLSKSFVLIGRQMVADEVRQRSVNAVSLVTGVVFDPA